MNWVGGTLSRLRGRDDKKIQREFFEKKRYEKTLDSFPVGMQSPTKKKELAISQDLLSLHTVLQTHSETNNRLHKQFKHPNMLNLKPKAGLKRTISFDLMPEPVLNEKYHTRSEGFQDLETPTSLLDVKKWRGEYKQGRTLGMSKAAPCLRQFQELEQAVFQREGVDECGKENIPPTEGQAMQEQVALMEMGEREDNKRESSMQWNNRVCEESENVPGNAKWLEFLYGTNKANSKPKESVSDNQPTNYIIQYPTVQLPPHPNTNLSDLPKQSTAHMEVYDTEDLMEFEREKMIRRQPGQSEDPFYLTLTSNRDSFKGYKRPRIDSINSSSAVNAMRDKMGGFLDESVFATPADENILRPDGMLTENPLPSNRSGMRSIKDFIDHKTLKYDKFHDALTDEELEEIDSSAEDSDNTPTVVPTKSKFVVPFTSKDKSPTPLHKPKEEEQSSSKSYDRFLQSLVAPNATSESLEEKCGSSLKYEVISKGEADIPPSSNNDKIDSLMMPILKWKEKEATENSYSENIKDSIEIQAESDECDTQENKESITNEKAGSNPVEHQSVVIENINIEKSVSADLEADTNEKVVDSVDIDENSTYLLSGNNTQCSTDEPMVESVETRLEEQNDNSEDPEMNIIECNIELEGINESVDEIRLYNGLGSVDVNNIFASPETTQLETGLVRGETNEPPIEVPDEINTIKSVEIVNVETETNKSDLRENSQMEVDTVPEEMATCESQEENKLTDISNSINQSTYQDECIQASEQNTEIRAVSTNNEIECTETLTDCNIEEASKAALEGTEYSMIDTGVQYSQQSQGITVEDKSIDCALVTESKECQTSLRVIDGESQTCSFVTEKECQTYSFVTDRDCQTISFVTDGDCQTISFVTDRDCQTYIEYPEPIEESRELISQEIQTGEEIGSKIEILTSREIQTEEITRNNSGNQTDILLIRFPIECNDCEDKYEQYEYENFILYQQQIIKALQKEIEWSNL